MEKEPAKKSIQLSIGAVAIGASSILFAYWLKDFGGVLILSLFLGLSFFFAYRKRVIPWRLSLYMLIAHYIVGFFFIPSWGELLPIDLIFLVILWGICGLAAKLGVYLGNKYNVYHT